MPSAASVLPAARHTPFLALFFPPSPLNSVRKEDLDGPYIFPPFPSFASPVYAVNAKVINLPPNVLLFLFLPPPPSLSGRGEKRGVHQSTSPFPLLSFSSVFC